VLNEATQAGAAAVILDINTFGGRVDAAVLIRDSLLHAKLPTVAFVNKRAISAGALIALAAEKIVMADGGTIGAATPVAMGAPGAAPLPVSEKTVSYMRKEFGATAEARKRPPLLAEAMVDADVEVKGLVEKGKLLTLTADEALQHKLADLRANSIDAVLQSLGLGDAWSSGPEHLIEALFHSIFTQLTSHRHSLFAHSIC
jgi:membrane-bound serine protease (ClpP class)